MSRSLFYKPITRYYYDSYDPKEEVKVGRFIARGEWADGHLAYSRFDEDGYECEECSYAQYRTVIHGKACLCMQRI